MMFLIATQVEMKNGVVYKNKMCILRLIFTLTKHLLCDLDKRCYYMETSPLTYGSH